MTRREALQEVVAVFAAASVVLVSPIAAATQPFSPLPAPTTFPGCVLIRDHYGRHLWKLAGREGAG